MAATSSSPRSPARDHITERSLIWFYIGAFLGPFGSTIASVLIPTLAQEYTTTEEIVAVSITAYMGTFAFFLLFSGAISDNIGARQAVVAGCAIFGVASLICAVAPTIEVFIVGRALQGVGNAFTTSLLMASLGDLMPPHRLGKAVGIFAAFQMAGGLFGPVISGFLAQFNWRLSFHLSLIVSVLLAFYYWRYYSRLGVGLSGRENAANPFRAIANLWNLRMGLLFAMAFVGYMGAPSIAFFVAYDVEESWQVTPFVSGLVVAGYGLVNVVAAPQAGAWVDRFGRYRMVTLSMLLTALLMVGIAFIRWEIAFALLFAALGLPTVIMWTAIGTLAVEAFPKQRGAATSIFNGAKFGGWAIAPILFFWIAGLAGAAVTYIVAGVISLFMLIPVLLYARLETSRVQQPSLGAPQRSAGRV